MSTIGNASTKIWLGALLVISIMVAIFLVPVSWGDSMVPDALAEATDISGRSLSPYFFVKSDDPELDQMPLKTTRVDVNIAGVIADVKVVQIYKNEGLKPIEAVYVFPASTKASVYGMKMTIGERTITAEIRRREDARRMYEKAKEEGENASLLEQQRPNVFQMNVANILPGDEVKTELHYTELIDAIDGRYEFFFPTVVGPRYSSQAAETASSSARWIENPYLHRGKLPFHKLEIAVQVSSGMPIRTMTCFSHRTDIQYLDTSTAKVILAPSESFSANRDFILSYRLAGDQIETGLLLYRGDDENYFLLMLQPPKDFHESEIPPREYIFVVDVSGSMHGYPLDVSKELLRNLVSSLRPVDLFNVLLFSGGSRLLAPESVAANQQNIRKAIDLIDSQKGGGGTELLPALERAFNLPVQKGFSRIFVIATDGYVTIEAEAFDFIRSRLGESNFFTFGIGTSVNRYLIEGLARTGAGEPFVVVNPQEATAKAEKFRRYVQSPLLTQNKLVFSGFSVFDVEPASIPDVFADRPIVVFGKWRGEPKGKISLHGTSGKGGFHKSVDVSSAKVSSSNSALRYLWARARIAQIDDYGRLSRDLKHIPEVTELGLKYNLLTAYTSFVAVDTMVRVIDGKSVTIKQPLPLPEGVSDYAVGQSGPISAARSMAYHPASALPLYVRESGSNSIKGETEASLGKNTMGTKGNETGSGAVHLHPRLVKATASGVLSEVTLRRLVAEKLSQLTGCKAVLPIQPFKIKVKFTAVESGAVDDLHIDAPAHTPHEINRCIEEAIRKWSFPAAAGRTMVMITIVIG